MIRLLLTNDLHLAARAPQSRRDNWADAIFAKLDQIHQVAVKLRVDALLIAGDFFHTKTVPYSVTNRLADWCWRYRQETGGRILGIAGNHDELQERVESVETQALGALFRSRLIEDVAYVPSLVVSRFAVELASMVQVVGVPYPDALDAANFVRAASPLGSATPVIMMGHCFATQAGGETFGVPTHRYGALQALCPNVDVWHFGHDHSDHGIVTSELAIPKTYFVNIGALGRGSIAKEDAGRDVKVALVEVTGFSLSQRAVSVKQFKLKVAPAAEVFDLEKKASMDADVERVSEFVAQLSADLLAAPSAGAVLADRIDALQLPVAVRTRVLQYLSDAAAAV